MYLLPPYFGRIKAGLHGHPKYSAKINSTPFNCTNGFELYKRLLVRLEQRKYSTCNCTDLVLARFTLNLTKQSPSQHMILRTSVAIQCFSFSDSNQRFRLLNLYCSVPVGRQGVKQRLVQTLTQTCTGTGNRVKSNFTGEFLVDTKVAQSNQALFLVIMQNSMVYIYVL